MWPSSFWNSPRRWSHMLWKSAHQLQAEPQPRLEGTCKECSSSASRITWVIFQHHIPNTVFRLSPQAFVGRLAWLWLSADPNCFRTLPRLPENIRCLSPTNYLSGKKLFLVWKTFPFFFLFRCVVWLVWKINQPTPQHNPRRQTSAWLHIRVSAESLQQTKLWGLWTTVTLSLCVSLWVPLSVFQNLYTLHS